MSGAARWASEPKTAGKTFPIRKGIPSALLAAKQTPAKSANTKSRRLPLRWTK
jgi:hypothetical protein